MCKYFPSTYLFFQRRFWIIKNLRNLQLKHPRINHRTYLTKKKRKFMNCTLNLARMRWHRLVHKIHSKITPSCKINTNSQLTMVKKHNRTLRQDLIKLVSYRAANQAWWPTTNTTTISKHRAPPAKVTTLNNPSPKNQQCRAKLKAPQFCQREHRTLNWLPTNLKRDWKNTKLSNKPKGWCHTTFMRIQGNSSWLRKRKATTHSARQVTARSQGQGKVS